MAKSYLDESGNLIKLSKAEIKQLSKSERVNYTNHQKALSGAPDLSTNSRIGDIRAESRGLKASAQVPNSTRELMSETSGRRTQAPVDIAAKQQAQVAADAKGIRANYLARKRSNAGAISAGHRQQAAGESRVRRRKAANLRNTLLEAQSAGDRVRVAGGREPLGETVAEKARRARRSVSNAATGAVSGAAARKVGNVVGGTAKGFKEGYAQPDPKPATSETPDTPKTKRQTLSEGITKGRASVRNAGKTALGKMKGASEYALKKAGPLGTLIGAGMAVNDYGKFKEAGSTQAGFDTLSTLADNAAFGYGGEIGGGILSLIQGNSFGAGWDKAAAEEVARKALLNGQQQPQGTTQQPQSNAEAILAGNVQGADGTPLPNPQQASNPNMNMVSNGDGSGGFAVPTGDGATLPFGRTAENQAQIDANVASINATTDVITGANKEIRGGKRQGMSPEQAQIMRLAKKMRSGNFGDKQRNNVLQQKINALQGIEASNTSRSNAISVAQTAAAKQQADAVQKQQAAQVAANQRLTTLASNPDTAGLAAGELLGVQAGGYLDPGQRSNVKGFANQNMQDRSLWDAGASFFSFGDRPSTVNQSDPSFRNWKPIKGGGAIGSVFGAGEGWSADNGAVIRRSGMGIGQQNLIDEAIRRDNQR